MGNGGLQSASSRVAPRSGLSRTRLFRYALLTGVAAWVSACTEAQMNAPTPMQAPLGPAAAASGSPRPLTSRGLQEPEVANPTPALPSSRAEIISGNGTLIGSVPAQAATVTPQGDITLSFVNADVREVLPRVLGDILHLNYAVDPKVQGTITVQTSRPIRQQDVLPVLQETLRASGLALSEANGVYRVTTSDEAGHTGTAGVSVGLRAPGAAGAPGVNVQILPLKYASAADLQKTLQPFMPKDAVLEADTTRNLLILSGVAIDLSTVTDMVRAFDVDWIAGMSYGIVPLQTGAPKQVADELATIFGPKGSVPLPGMLSFAPLERMNAILVVSPQRAYIEQARMWIQRLDRGET